MVPIMTNLLVEHSFTHWSFWEDHLLLFFFLLITFSVTRCLKRIKLPFVNKNALFSHCRKCFFPLFPLPEEIKSPSKYNIALLYWLLLLSVLCQWLKQIIVLSNPSLLSLFLSFGEGIFTQNKFWNLDLAFWKNKLFWCKFKTICYLKSCNFLVMFLENGMICSYVDDLASGEGILWGDFLLLWVSEQEARVKTQDFVWEKFIFIKHLFYQHE